MSLSQFMSCIEALDNAARYGTLFDYSQRLLFIARRYYPDGLPRLVNGRIACLVSEKEKSAQLTLI